MENIGFCGGQRPYVESRAYSLALSFCSVLFFVAPFSTSRCCSGLLGERKGWHFRYECSDLHLDY
jgi:hypothetical protein